MRTYYSDDDWRNGRPVSDETLEEIRLAQGNVVARDVMLDAMAREIQERRAADLTAFEEIVLQSHLSRIADDPLTDRAVVRTIDKLLGSESGATATVVVREPDQGDMCSRIAESIEKRASAIGGPAQAAMLEIAAAVREAGR